MKNKNIVVTGATSGIGQQAALELARMGANITIVSRSEDKCRNTVQMIQSKSGNTNVDYVVGDLSVVSEIREVADKIRARLNQLDVLVNNAGAYFSDRQMTSDGYEKTFALNHLNYFLLTNELLDLLKRAASENGEARIVNVSSDAHRFVRSGVSFDDLKRERDYSGMTVYGETKMMNIMFTEEMARRLDGTGVTVNAMHPGLVRSNFGGGGSGITSIIFSVLKAVGGRSVEKGAETVVWLASSPEVEGITGKYWADRKIKEPTAEAEKVISQKKLWDVSEQLTGMRETSEPSMA